jgi:BMFP domain-containing protein YqiC
VGRAIDRLSLVADRVHGSNAAIDRSKARGACLQVTEITMLNSKTLDELAARIGKALENSPVRDIEKNAKAMLKSGLARLDLVTREEFDIQVEVLRKTRDKVERLEARVAELEARTPPPPQTMV